MIRGTAWLGVLLLATSVATLVVPSGSQALTVRAQIVITGDADFTAANGVVGGTGTPSDPYVISGWEIDTAPSAAVVVRNTRAWFVLRDIKINYMQTNTNGVEFSDVHNGRVENVSASAYYSFRFSGVRNIVVNGSCACTNGYGIAVVSSADVLVENNVVRNGGSDGIYVTGGSANVTLRSNRISEYSNGAGVRIESSTFVNVVGNDLQTRAGIVLASSSDSAIADNVIRYGIDEVLAVRGSSRVSILRNTADFSPSGFRLESSVNLTVAANVLPWWGIRLIGSAPEHFSSHAISANNTVRGRPILYFARCADLVVDGGSPHQVIVAECQRVRIANVTVTNAGTGILLAFTSDALIAGNAVNGSGEGVWLVGTSNASLMGNTLRSNTYGVVLSGASLTTVFHNNFLSNLFPGLDDRANAWDGAYPTGGNYWHSYTGEDRCGGPGQNVCPDPDGIGDVPFAIDADSGDRYPLITPFGVPAQPPVVAFGYTPNPAVATEPTVFFPVNTYDPDGVIVSYQWDFGGDIRDAPGGTHTYYFSSPGTYKVRLWVKDNSGLMSFSEQNVAVVAPLVRPIASFSVQPGVGFVGDTFLLDAAASSDPFGTIVSYQWDFGDGTQAEGPLVSHAYQTAGDLTATLVVTNDRGLTDSSSQIVSVFVVPGLELFGHPSGFRIPVPVGWTRQVDISSGGTVVELLVEGPTWNRIQTTVIVDTGEDPTVRETEAYLRELVNATIAELQRSRPDAYLRENAVYRTISNHSTVSFSVGYGGLPAIQDVTVVVSDPHDRFWVIILTAEDTLYPRFEPMFDSIVSGFEITLALPPPPPPPPPPPSEDLQPTWPSIGFLALIVSVLSACAAGLVVWLLARSRHQGKPPD